MCCVSRFETFRYETQYERRSAVKWPSTIDASGNLLQKIRVQTTGASLIPLPKAWQIISNLNTRD
jgi:hypothetical protein